MSDPAADCNCEQALRLRQQIKCLLRELDDQIEEVRNVKLELEALHGAIEAAYQRGLEDGRKGESMAWAAQLRRHI